MRARVYNDYTHTHTHSHTYMRVCVCVCVCVCVLKMTWFVHGNKANKENDEAVGIRTLNKYVFFYIISRRPYFFFLW